MPIALNPTATTLYDARPLDNRPPAPRNRLESDPTMAERLQQRLELTRERAAELAEERRDALREQQAEQARQAAEEATRTLQDRLRQQQVGRLLEARREDQAAAVPDSLPAQSAVQPPEASQLSFGPPQRVTTRTAIEAIATYRETRALSA